MLLVCVTQSNTDQVPVTTWRQARLYPPAGRAPLDSLPTVYEPQFPDLKNGNNKGCCKDQMSLAQCLARDDGSAGGGYS